MLKTPTAGLPRFYFNRATRIWIPYFLAVAAVLLLSLLRKEFSAKWLEIAAYQLTFVYNLFGTPQLEQFRNAMPLQGTGHHFWSINAEEQFYLLAPLLLTPLLGRWGRHPVLWLALAVLTWYLNFYQSIVFGVAAAALCQHWGIERLSLTIRTFAACCAVAALSAIVLGYSYNHWVAFMGIGVVLAFSTQGPEHRIGQFLGGMSYPLYLNHWMGAFVANGLLTPWGLRESIAKTVLATAAALVIGALAYVLVDRNIARYRNRYYTDNLGMGLLAASFALMSIGLTLGWYWQHP
ncbi:acyltransferase [Curvibacter sp. CHRR-16]|uniref:acyltransferase family protein n=1 Tax=Curvibacter sp. CHRR-16 TaxID=2835872 RepID=UPI001BDA17A7|nr:acyltransferase [Curvibacter sp. CHRR-16]